MNKNTNLSVTQKNYFPRLPDCCAKQRRDCPTYFRYGSAWKKVKSSYFRHGSTWKKVKSSYFRHGFGCGGF